MERLEEIRKIRMFWGDSEYNITRNAGRGEYVIVQKAKEDVGALLSLIDQYETALNQAKDKSQILASHCAHAMDSGRSVHVSYAFEKSQEVYELLRDTLEKE